MGIKWHFDQEDDRPGPNTPLGVWLHARPECERFRSDEDRERVIDEVAGAHTFWSHGSAWVLVTAGLTIGLATAAFALLANRLGLSWNAYALGGFAGFAGFLAVTAVHDVLRRRRALRHMWLRMADLGISICRKCGYDLRGSPGPRCPECGTPFHCLRDT